MYSGDIQPFAHCKVWCTHRHKQNIQVSWTKVEREYGCSLFGFVYFEYFKSLKYSNAIDIEILNSNIEYSKADNNIYYSNIYNW